MEKIKAVLRWLAVWGKPIIRKEIKEKLAPEVKAAIKKKTRGLSAKAKRELDEALCIIIEDFCENL
jgi:hypothetical protein